MMIYADDDAIPKAALSRFAEAAGFALVKMEKRVDNETTYTLTRLDDLSRRCTDRPLSA